MTDILNTNEERIGPYVVIGSLTGDAQSDSFRALDTQLNRYVAIKKLSPTLANYPGVFERLEQVVAKRQQINHDNIIYCIDVAQEDNKQPYLVFEFIEGPTLLNLIQNEASPPVINLLELLIQATDALYFAEKNGMIHGDLTPDDMTISPAGQLKLYDLGLTHAIRQYPGIDPSLFPLDQNYAAPELSGIGAADFRSDMYSLGVIFYQLLCRQHPGSNPQPLYNVDPEIPPRLSSIIDRMITREPNARFIDYETLLSDLRAVHQSYSERLGNYEQPLDEYEETGHDVYDEEQPPLRQTSELFQPMPAMDDEDFESLPETSTPTTQPVAASVEMNYGGEGVVQRPIPEVIDVHHQFNLRNWVVSIFALVMVIGGITLIFNQSDNNETSSTGLISGFFTETIPGIFGVSKDDTELEILAREMTKDNIRLIFTMLEDYQQSESEYPFTLNDLIEKSLISQSDILDGWDTEFNYNSSRREISSAGPDQTFNSEDDYIFRNGRFVQQPEPLEEEIVNESI